MADVTRVDVDLFLTMLAAAFSRTRDLVQRILLSAAETHRRERHARRDREALERLEEQARRRAVGGERGRGAARGRAGALDDLGDQQLDRPLALELRHFRLVLAVQELGGLTRAMVYAGSRALVVSHWSVDSEASVRLMTGLFASHAPSMAEALQQSQAALQADPDHAHLVAAGDEGTGDECAKHH